MCNFCLLNLWQILFLACWLTLFFIQKYADDFYMVRSICLFIKMFFHLLFAWKVHPCLEFNHICEFSLLSSPFPFGFLPPYLLLPSSSLSFPSWWHARSLYSLSSSFMCIREVLNFLQINTTHLSLRLFLGFFCGWFSHFFRTSVLLVCIEAIDYCVFMLYQLLNAVIKF